MRQKLKRRRGCRQRSAKRGSWAAALWFVCTPVLCWGAVATQPGGSGRLGVIWCCPAQSYLAQFSHCHQRDFEASAWSVWMRRGQVAEQNISLGPNLVGSDISRQKFCKRLGRAWARSSCWAFNGQVMVLSSTWGRDDKKISANTCILKH